MINASVYFSASGLLVVGMLFGLACLSKVRTAVMGNRLSAVCVALAILFALLRHDPASLQPGLIIWPIVLGTIFGLWWAGRVRMIAMPQTIAMLKSFCGAAAAVVGVIKLFEGADDLFSLITAGLALAVGMVTLAGSLVAAGKLSGRLNQRPVVWPGHQILTALALGLSLFWAGTAGCPFLPAWLTVTACAAFSGFLGVSFAIRIGGADMPITISLLNSLSGTAIASAGMSVGDPLLISVGGVVGSAGLLLTQSMCHAMNRGLSDILMGRTSVAAAASSSPAAAPMAEAAPAGPEAGPEPAADLGAILRSARRVIIIPGYGMALAQAQAQVKELADKLEAGGALVDYAIHPVAGRMPGHMNVLLAEVAVPYEQLKEMDEINPAFPECDLAFVVGANDVINPAAHTAEGTPIYGMPVLAVEAARHIIICNLDLKPGYAGVDNPLYKNPKAALLLGDAVETVGGLIEKLRK